MTHRTPGDIHRRRTIADAASGLYPEPDAAPIDHDAVRSAVRRARRLYTTRYDAEAVAEVTAALRGHITALTPACEEIRDGLPDDAPGRARITASVTLAAQLMGEGPNTGEMGALVHMQLLADSAHFLASYIRQAGQ